MKSLKGSGEFGLDGGLHTSKDRMTMRRGEAVKSRSGTGILETRYSLTASMLNLSWADTGTTGEPSATVPRKNYFCG